MDPLKAYRSPEERERTLDRLAQRAGAELCVLGESVEGRPLRAARVPGAPGAKRSLLLSAGIHGPEYLGVEVALALLEGAREGAARALLEEAELWVLPCVNPDGYARTWELRGEGPIAAMRANARGVDLNRNFPLPAPQRPVRFTFDGWRTGSEDPSNAFYRGAHPASEPETRALLALAERAPLHACLSLHSSMGTLLPPCVPVSAHRLGYRTLARSFAAAQPRVRYRHVQLGAFDIFTGEQDDWMHHLRGAWSLTVEHYPVWVDVGRFAQPGLFRRFNPPDPGPWVANDLPGVLSYFRAALAMPPP